MVTGARGDRTPAQASASGSSTSGSRRPAGPLAVTVPDPALVVLMGAAGSGKSTLSARHFAADEILSSDALRGTLSGDPTDQSVSRAAFAILHRRAATRLEAGTMTVIDATNVDRRARAPLTAIARSAGAPAVAIVLDLPLDLVLERNRRRAERVVPAAIVRRQWDRLRASLDTGGIHDERFDLVIRLTNASDLDRLVIHREASAG